MTASSAAGHLPDPSSLIDLDRLVSAYYEDQPDPSVAEQRVTFGTSGHRGSSLARTFNEAHVELTPERHDVPPIVDLDKRFYKLVGDFEARFPSGPPSLVACDRLSVVGDVVFGRDVVVSGSVTLEHAAGEQLSVADGTVLEAEA